MLVALTKIPALMYNAGKLQGYEDPLITSGITLKTYPFEGTTTQDAINYFATRPLVRLLTAFPTNYTPPSVVPDLNSDIRYFQEDYTAEQWDAVCRLMNQNPVYVELSLIKGVNVWVDESWPGEHNLLWQVSVADEDLPEDPSEKYPPFASIMTGDRYFDVNPNRDFT